MSNEIQFHTYELEHNRIITVLRVEHEVWLSGSPELAAELSDVLGEEGGTYRIRPKQIRRVELLEEVPPGTVLPRGELAPFRRVIYDVVHKFGEVACGTLLVSGAVAVISGGIGLVFPPALGVAVESAKVAGISMGSLLALGLIVEEPDKVRSGYVRFQAQCSDQMPKHKAEILAHAEFVGTMKKTHFEKLCDQLHTLDLDAEIAAVESHA